MADSVQPNLNQTYTEPVQYPTQQVMHERIIGGIFAALGQAAQIPGQLATIQHAENAIPNQEAQQLGSMVAAGELQKRDLSQQEQKDIENKIAQGNANLAEANQYGQWMLSKAQFVENTKITDFIRGLDKDATQALMRSPDMIQRKIGELAHTPDSQNHFLQLMGDQMAIQDRQELMTRIMNDQSKLPTQHMEDIIQRRLSSPIGPGDNSYHDILDPTIQSFYRASLGQSVANMEQASAERHAQQVLQASEQTNQINLVTNLINDDVQGYFSNTKDAIAQLNTRYQAFARNEKFRNSDLTSEQLKSAFYANVNTWIQSADPRRASRLVNGIAEGSPDSDIGRFMKNIQAQTTERLQGYQNGQYKIVTDNAKDTYDPTALNALDQKIQVLAQQGMIRKENVKDWQNNVYPERLAAAESFSRVTSVAQGLSTSDGQVLRPEDKPLIDRAVAQLRFNKDNPMSEADIYSNILARGGYLTDSIKNRINALSNSSNNAELGQAMAILSQMTSKAPGATRNLIDSGDISPKAQLAQRLYSGTGEDPISISQRMVTAPLKYIQDAQDIVANPQKHFSDIKDSLNSRITTMMQTFPSLPANFLTTQRTQTYISNAITGRPDFVDKSVMDAAQAKYQDYYIKYKTENPGAIDIDINKAILPKVDAYVKQNYSVLPFGDFRSPVANNRVGYAVGAKPFIAQDGADPIPGLYSVDSAAAQGSAAALATFSTLMMKDIAAKRDMKLSSLQALPNDVNQDKDGNWVLNIRNGDSTDNKPVASIKFKSIADIAKFNDEYLTNRDATGEMPYSTVMGVKIYPALQQQVNLYQPNKPAQDKAKALFQEALDKYVVLH